MIKTDLTNLKNVSFKDKDLHKRILAAHTKIRCVDVKHETVWVDLPKIINAAEIKEINKTAAWIRDNYDVLLVIGIGGSYLGARAGLEFLSSTVNFPVKFLGLSFDPLPIIRFLETHRNKRVCVNIISKSGTTLETIATYNIVQDYCKHVIITTADYSPLGKFADTHGITFFNIPAGVGGRYSCLSAVGLLPLAVAGIDIQQIMEGATIAYYELASNNLEENDAYRYAAARYLLHTKTRKDVEVLASFYEGLQGIGEWHQQLFCESEGKDGKGLLVQPMIFTRDLHSMGQYIQQGKPILFETFINVANPVTDIKFKPNAQGFNVAAKSMEQLNTAAFAGTVRAHTDAGVPVIILNLERGDARGFGYLIYFFQIACAMSAYLLGVNPFDQPGVEFYKKNMRDLLKND